jgi:Secretion system C-terminal sorting domain
MKNKLLSTIFWVLVIPLSISAQCRGILSQSIVSVGGLDKTSRMFSCWTIGQSFSESARGADVYPKPYYGFQQPTSVAPSIGTDCRNVTGTQESRLAHFNLNIFPNPAQSTFKISLDNVHNEQLTGRLFDCLGRQMLMIHIEGENFDCNINHLAAGVYFLRIQDSHLATQTFKIIKH